MAAGICWWAQAVVSCVQSASSSLGRLLLSVLTAICCLTAEGTQTSARGMIAAPMPFAAFFAFPVGGKLCREQGSLNRNQLTY